MSLNKESYPEKIYCNQYYNSQNIFIGKLEPIHNNVKYSIEYTRSDLIPRWHKIADGDLPKKHGNYLTVDEYNNYSIAYYGEIDSLREPGYIDWSLIKEGRRPVAWQEINEYDVSG